MTLSEWRTEITQRVVNAAGSVIEEQKVIRWIKKAWSEQYTFEALSEVDPEFRALDTRLYAAMDYMMAQSKSESLELRRIVSMRAAEASDNDTLLRGIQVVHLLIRFFRNVGGNDHAFLLKTLFDIPPATDIDSLQNIYYNWHKILSQTRGVESLDRFTLRVTWYEKIERVPEIKPYLVQWDIIKEGHPDKTYDKLIDITNTLLSLTRDKRAQAKSEQAVGAMFKPKKAAPGQEVTPKAKPKSKAQAKKGKNDGKGEENPDKDPPPPQAVPGETRQSAKARKNSPCYFFHKGKCHNGHKCNYSHDPISDEAKSKLVRPPPKQDPASPGPRSGSAGSDRSNRSPSANSQKSGSQRSSSNSSRSSKTSQSSHASKGTNKSGSGSSGSGKFFIRHCRKFLKGQCKDKNCKRPHLSQKELKKAEEEANKKPRKDNR